ncbi:hypothetical protein ACHAXS_005617 [Conticribra weissflogii]
MLPMPMPWRGERQIRINRTSVSGRWSRYRDLFEGGGRRFLLEGRMSWCEFNSSFLLV